MAVCRHRPEREVSVGRVVWRQHIFAFKCPDRKPDGVVARRSISWRLNRGCACIMPESSHLLSCSHPSWRRPCVAQDKSTLQRPRAILTPALSADSASTDNRSFLLHAISIVQIGARSSGVFPPNKRFVYLVKNSSVILRFCRGIQDR